MNEIVRHLSIEGLVQGVGFRWAMVQAARAYAVVGWVRNRRDGTVEALIAGPEDDVLAVVDWARQGPTGAVVERVTVAAEPLGPPAGRDFRQLPTD